MKNENCWVSDKIQSIKNLLDIVVKFSETQSWVHLPDFGFDMVFERWS